MSKKTKDVWNKSVAFLKINGAKITFLLCPMLLNSYSHLSTLMFTRKTNQQHTLTPRCILQLERKRCLISLRKWAVLTPAFLRKLYPTYISENRSTDIHQFPGRKLGNVSNVCWFKCPYENNLCYTSCGSIWACKLPFTLIMNTQ